MTWAWSGVLWLGVGLALAEAVEATYARHGLPTDAGRYAAVTVLWPFLTGWLAVHALLTGKLPGK